MKASDGLQRRRFLGAVAGALVTATAPIPICERDRRPDRLAANVFGLRQLLINDLTGTLDELKKLGLSRLELVSFRGWDGHPYGSFAALAPMTGEAVAAALADAGMTARSSHVLAAELAPDRLSAMLDWMAPIGVTTLIRAGLPMAGDSPDPMFRAIEDLNAIGERLAAQGYKLMLHGDFALWRGFGGQSYFNHFIERVDPALCQLQLDLGATIQSGVDPVDLLDRHNAHVGSVHLRDGTPPPDPQTYVPSLALGEGVVPITAVVDAALQAGVRDFVLEMAMQPAGGELDAIARSIAFLRAERPALVR